MNKIKNLILATVITLTSVSANAALVATDWKTTDDSLVTLNESRGLEWLDLSQTYGMSYSQVSGLLDTTFAGWRLPTKNEVISMIRAGYNSSDNYYLSQGTFQEMYSNKASVVANAKHYASLIGSPNMRVEGIYADNGQILRSSVTSYATYARAMVNYSTSDSYFNANIGVYLVSDGGVTLGSIENPEINANNPNAPEITVPLPATLGFLGLGMIGLIASRRKNFN